MGGKRKSKKAAPKKKKAVVPRSFKCPFCNHEGSCEVKLDREAESGGISCRVCGESFHCRVSYLSDPVDVYCEWLDGLEGARASGGSAAAAATDGVPLINARAGAGAASASGSMSRAASGSAGGVAAASGGASAAARGGDDDFLAAEEDD